MKWIGLYATFVHIQAKLGQENLLKMVRWVRWHCPPDTGFEIQTLEVWGRARYLSVTEDPHNTKFYKWMAKKQFCFFQTAETGKRTLAWKAAVLTTTLGPPPFSTTWSTCIIWYRIRLIWQAMYISELQPEYSLVIRCDDTDILMKLLLHKEQLNPNIWMDVRKFSNNTRWFINVSQLAQKLGSRLCQAFWGYHHFPWSDYTALFFRKRKITFDQCNLWNMIIWIFLSHEAQLRGH